MAQAIPNYNTIHQTGPKQIGGGMVVFTKVEDRYQGGATLDLSQNNPPYRDWETDRKSTRLNSSHITRSRMPSSA